ncbi:MAG TPA: YceI family protein [Candidatus Paceibacterota bacterium]|nr:YceI family protein [Verrucomicrobiota bacterium]HSA09704.1 YceI family protein [Candidatus Paceibacterota bacterium]
MKKILGILGVIVVVALVAFLAVTRHLALQRAAKLDRALMEAEARVIQLESDLEAAKQRPAELAQARPASAAGTTAASPAAGPLARYAAFSRAGVTNLVRIEGTSTIHEWQVEGHLIGGSAELPQGFPAPATGPVEVKVSAFIPVRSLKSVEKDGRLYSDPMDEIMYGKLLEPTNKRITYTLTTLTPKPQPGGVTASFLYEATGNLCVAGVTNVITMPVTVTPDPAGTIQFAGSVKTKMTDFKIEPPSPSLGGVAIKTGDEVTLKFVWWVNRIKTAGT